MAALYVALFINVQLLVLSVAANLNPLTLAHVALCAFTLSNCLIGMRVAAEPDREMRAMLQECIDLGTRFELAIPSPKLVRLTRLQGLTLHKLYLLFLVIMDLYGTTKEAIKLGAI